MARRFAFLALFLLLGVLPLAAKPKISKLSATERGSKVSVSFELTGAFDVDQLNKALESGLPTGFTYHIEMVRYRPNWFDSTVGEARIEIISTYDSRTREYLVNYRRDGKLVRSETLNDPAELRKRMTTIVEPDLLSTGVWKPYKLHVRVRADLMREFLLNMIPWDVSTEWSKARVRTPKTR
ncbi:MAG: DUF4390 domain-containing protein [Acidobacteria bacterium]|nr:DUF4390 domain-containing protein [Acidobacteriota bacterium]